MRKSAAPKSGKRKPGNPKSETARLKSQLRIAQDRQTASAEILRTIGNVSGDAERSLYQIAETTKRLFEASSVSIFVADGDEWGQVIHDGASSKRIGAEVPVAQLRTGSHSLPGATFSENRQIHLPDIYNLDPAIADWPGVGPARAAGSRTISGTPLRRAGQAVGVLIVHRDRLAPFTADELALLQSFADQAAIAIENARLFNETQEALERQTASADILKVIASSPSNVQPVFNAVVLSARRLIGREMSAILICGEDATFRAVAGAGPDGLIPIDPIFAAPTKIDPEANFPSRAIVSKKNVHLPDWSAIDLPEQERNIREVIGWNSTLYLPMLRGEECIGVLLVGGTQPGIFSEADIALAESFRDQAVIALENTRLFNETREALERQTATAEVLKVISDSPGDLQPVFRSVLENATRICDARFGTLLRFDGNAFYFAADVGTPPALAEFVRRPGPFQGLPGGMVDRILSTRQVQHSPDYAAEIAPGLAAKLGGARSTLGVPILKDDVLVGAIVIYRQEVRPFSHREIDLVRSFAAQAAIAIENARLFNDTQEALERQTATADILKVIASSPADVQPVFEAIAERSNRLIDGLSTAVYSIVDDAMHLMAFTRNSPEADAALQAAFPRPLSEATGGDQIRNGEIVQIPDVELAVEWEVPTIRAMALLRGFRAVLLVPLLRDLATIGVISVTRREPGAFAAHHVQLLQTFADQAVIAIGNVRLFDEVQARTRDLSEALTYQTGSSNILKVIASSPTDVGPVLKAIVESACELCDAVDAIVLLKDVDDLRTSAHHGPIPLDMERWPISPKWVAGRAFLDRKPVHVHDLLSAEGDEFPDTRQRTPRTGTRSILSVPLLREGKSIGTIVLRRTEVHPFSDKQIALLQTFADQAVIAIGNVQLFDEVQAKTRELAARNSAYSEQIDHQSATIDILKAMSASQGDAQPVFDVIVRRARQICNTDLAVVLEFDGTLAHLRSIHVDETSTPPRVVEAYRGLFPQPPSRASVALRAIYYGQIIHIPNMAEDVDLSQASRDIGRKGAMAIPLMRDGQVIGSIGLSAKVTGGFSEAQIELLKTFAEQAVIAIRSAETFRELNTRTRDLSESLQQQTATADVLKVISRSAFDLQPVLDTLVASAAQLCGADAGIIWLRKDDLFHAAAASGFSPQEMAFFRDNPRSIHDKSLAPRVLRYRRTVHIPDRSLDPEFAFPGTSSLPSTMLGVPLLRDDRIEGVFTLTRSDVAPFRPRQIELVESFADQAVIAIENARLFKAVQQRTRELAQSLDDLRAAQDRLVQTEKLASLGQLTAGIAHEIKNPLNFVNNFSALSAELTDELNDVLRPVTLENKVREEVDELTGMLKDNLEKVVQHGKRADSIVKNMLLHSRESSGERRPADINALLDESLNLAYHGARAEKSGFDIILQRDFDAGAGEIELFPQEITRAFLNLISNGFYAATRRKIENGDSRFEPVLAAATRNLGDTVEIRIRDNGTGIPAEVKEKMFNPFFTTKPAGEGTGLGLSMSHDIIVKQHGGRIDVDTEPGLFTEFKIILPRASRR